MKRVHLIILLLAATLAVHAQPDGNQPPPRSTNIMGLKLAYFTRQLTLTNEESQKFWPVYYSYSDELKKIRQGKKDDVLQLEEDMLNVRKKYKSEFKKVLLTDERVNKALTADRDFSNEVRRELMERAKMRGGPRAMKKGGGRN